MRPVALLFVLAVALAGCTSSTSPPRGPADGGGLGDALCAATDAETAAEARASFAPAHDPLHELARELQSADARTVAARLLEAKQRVEAAVADELPLPDLAPRLEELLTAVTEATTELDRPTPTCN